MIARYLSPFRLFKHIGHFCENIQLKCKLLYFTLVYNHFMDTSYVADVCMGPMFWFIENFTNTIGRLLVISVTLLTASVVIISYWLGVPYWWERNPIICIILVTFGHWILVNIVFNYYMACRVLPGYPPEGELISEAVSICKKCIAPKPPRAHHCSVCSRCILKMDHHCPWLNNCVGYKNHRYFYLYMVYMVVGVTFLIFSGYDLGYTILYLESDDEIEGHSVKINKTGALIPVTDLIDVTVFENDLKTMQEKRLRRRCILFIALLCVGVLFALGSLSAWHAQLITHNETSVETHINKAESSRLKDLGKQYVNPYDLGPKRNWRHFLGIDPCRNFWFQILWPTIYQPYGDGLCWPTVQTEDELDIPPVVFKKCNI